MKILISILITFCSPLAFANTVSVNCNDEVNMKDMAKSLEGDFGRSAKLKADRDHVWIAQFDAHNSCHIKSTPSEGKASYKEGSTSRSLIGEASCYDGKTLLNKYQFFWTANPTSSDVAGTNCLIESVKAN